MGMFASSILLEEVLTNPHFPSSRAVLSNINLTIHAGQKVFICGETGRYAIPIYEAFPSNPFPPAHLPSVLFLC